MFRYDSGKYFKWVAADDLLATEFIASCVVRLESDPSAALSYPRTAIIDAAGNVMHEYHDPLKVDATDPVSRFCEFPNSVGECNAVFGLIRTEMLFETALIGRYINADNHPLAELSLLGRLIRVPDPLLFRRDHHRLRVRIRASRRSYSSSIRRCAANWFYLSGGV